ncbi:DUF4132 domain-containing protein [Fibrisoma montanum]|uniref:DUF4132 domain-containing protein n=1 Tax=Fibrisoma montanum TaxID=2305895 RepID=A0A418MAV6_9BACT|nr:DUF4132 domain-containing protein [Fibrisoma montanum]RIV23470.1 DUF4132 domain-containing protein [Fibrisoma montanum]
METLKQVFANLNSSDKDIFTGEFSDLILDWFTNSKLSIVTFEQKFYEPLFNSWKQESYLGQRIASSSSLQAAYHQLAAILYLTYQTKNQVFFDQLFKQLFTEKSYSEERSLIYESIRSCTSLVRGLPNNSSLRSSVELSRMLLRAYHALCIRKDQNISTPYNIASSFVYEKRELTPLDINDYLIFLENVRAHGTPYIFLRIGSELLTHEHIHLKSCVKFYNQTHQPTLSTETCIQLSNFLTFKQLPIFLRTDWKQRKKLKANNIENFETFLTYSRQNWEEMLIAISYFLNYEYLHDEVKGIWASALSELLRGVQPRREWMLSFLRATHKVDSFIMQHLVIPLFTNIADKLEYTDDLVYEFEQMLFQPKYYGEIICRPEGIQILRQLATRIDNIDLKALFLNRLNPCRIHSQSDTLIWYELERDNNDKKHSYFRNLLNDLSLIIPAALTNVKRPNIYNEDGGTLFHMNVNGEDVQIDFPVQDINQVLRKQQTGYRLIIIPIRQLTLRTQYTDGKTYTIGSLAFMAESEYQYFVNTYLAVRFPNLLSLDLYALLNFDNQNKIPFHQLKEQVLQRVEPTNSNRFLSDVNWGWFKERYINGLNSRESWYRIMDFLISTPASKSPTIKWLTEAKRHVTQFGEERFFQELRVLMTDSGKEEFWYLDVNRNTIKAFIWLCVHYTTENSLQIVRMIVEEAYTKISGIGPRCTSLGNLGLDSLARSGKLAAFGVLCLMKTKSRYNRFTVQIEKAIALFIANSNVDEELLSDQSIPVYSFSAQSRKTIFLEDYRLELSVRGMKLYKEWYDLSGKKLKTTPKLKLDLREIDAEVKQVHGVLSDIQKRLRTYWLNDRRWKGADWKTYLYSHPLVRPVITHMIWRNQTTQQDFVIEDAGLFSLSGEPVALQDDDIVLLWHPLLSDRQTIQQWQQLFWQREILQPERQAFREFYPFSETEANLVSTMRFSGHFLQVNKLMAIANNLGWTFTYVHEGASWPRRYVKALDITAHLICDYDRNDLYIPTKELVFTRGNTVKLDESRSAWNQVQIRDLPPTALSELCRDIDLFIASTSIADDSVLSGSRSDLGAYRISYQSGLFSENASGKIRQQILTWLLPELGLQNVSFQGNYLCFNGKLNAYRINLGSGFAQIKDSGKHINLLPSQNAKPSSKIQLPIEDDPTLTIIIAKTLFLYNDSSIKDESIKSQLT